MRVALLGLYHEANTFSASTVSWQQLDAGTQRGAALLDAHRGAETTVSGFLDVLADAPGVEAVPLLYATVTPAGPLSSEAFARYRGEAERLLRGSGPFDAVLLALHGAAVSTDVSDVDGAIAALARDCAGAGVPIGVGFDMHANLTPAMAAVVDVMVGYRTNPHMDARVRGREVARIVLAAARGELRPSLALRQLPAVLNILRQGTDAEPMTRLLAEVAAIEALPGVLTASVVQGYPYADVPEMGMSALVVSDGRADLAAASADRLAAATWALRQEFLGVAEPVEQALDPARGGGGEGTVLLLDVGDNVGGGAPGDSTYVLAAARALGAERVLAVIADADAAALAHRIGAGGAFSAAVGAPELELEGRVGALGDGRFEETETSHGGQRDYDAGPSAAIVTSDGWTVVLTSRPVIPSSLAQLTQLGVDPRAFRFVVAKGVNSPLAAYGPIAERVVQVETPGITRADVEALAYRRRRRPLFPFEVERGAA